MKKFSTHFTESYIPEGKVAKRDFFSRKNKDEFIKRGNKGDILDLQGNKLPIKDKAEWKGVVSDLKKADGPDDLPADWTRRLGKAVAPMTQIDKILNGMSTTDGSDPSGEDWEAGITVALDKLAGKDFTDSPEWERFGKYWGDWEEQALKTAEAFRKQLKIKELKQTGSQRAKLAPTWKGTNATPKTDLLGGKHRISLKKAGGSQLMSAGKDEAISTLEAAMATYGVSGKGKREFNILLKSFEDNLIKMSEKGQMSALRKKAKNDPKLAAEIELADTKTAQINADIEKYINNSEGFKAHFCWEAATGHGKFGKNTWPTATIIVTFKGEGGIANTLLLDTPDKAGKVLGKGNRFRASFKSSGSSAPYLALRSQPASKVKQQINAGYIPTFAEIVVEETANSGLFLTEDLMQLDEFAMLDKLKRGAKAMSTSVVNAAKKALAAIQKRLSQAFNMIKKLGARAWRGLLNFFGLVIGSVKTTSGGGYPVDEFLYKALL